MGLGTNVKGIIIGVMALIIFLSLGTDIVGYVGSIANSSAATFPSGLANTVAGFIGVAFLVGLIVYLYSWFSGGK